jgi:3-oxoacyl-[acyl-carrier protein] reductase
MTHDRTRVALVTGAAQNIGAAVALQLARDGFAVAVNYRSESSAADADAVVEAIREAGGRAARFQADVARPAEINVMMRAIGEALGAPTVLVNNAATSVASSVSWLEITPEEWNRVIEANLAGAFLCARAVYPAMNQQGEGSIVNMSSVRPLLGLPGNLHYTSSKAGLIGFTRTLAREVGVDNIRVNALIVGAIKTKDETEYGSQAEIDATLSELQSLKRRGEPSDIADAVSFLVSPSSSFITGQCITVDGGWVMS